MEPDVGQQTRVIKHFHFTEWELDSLPYISAFIELRRRVRQYTDKFRADAPIVVHCRFIYFSYFWYIFTNKIFKLFVDLKFGRKYHSKISSKKKKKKKRIAYMFC